ncbi:hypothetical protein B0H14DRAFT_3759951 [Mycena olivaceomarginata]|nr:hypothetical protein B0H14DRAFT_3759951 [Mycena olivaceomarginata]
MRAHVSITALSPSSSLPLTSLPAPRPSLFASFTALAPLMAGHPYVDVSHAPFPCSAPVATMHTGAPVVRRLTRNVCLPLSAYDARPALFAASFWHVAWPHLLAFASYATRHRPQSCRPRSKFHPTPVTAPHQLVIVLWRLDTRGMSVPPPLCPSFPSLFVVILGVGRKDDVRTSGASSYLSSPCCAVLPYRSAWRTRRCYYLLEDDQRRRTHVDPSTACGWGFLWLGTRGDDSVPSTTSPSSHCERWKPMIAASSAPSPTHAPTTPQPFALVDLDRGVLRLTPSPAALRCVTRCVTHRKGRSSPVRAPPHNPRYLRVAPTTRARPVLRDTPQPTAYSVRAFPSLSRLTRAPSALPCITHNTYVTSSVSASPSIAYPLRAARMHDALDIRIPFDSWARALPAIPAIAVSPSGRRYLWWNPIVSQTSLSSSPTASYAVFYFILSSPFYRCTHDALLCNLYDLRPFSPGQ